jgi:O-methyltransferase involved in polyketide biosynthesis
MVWNMKGNLTEDVSSTAFVVNYSRSRLVDISKDKYAEYWVTPEAISLYHELEEKAFKHDDLNVSLRTRFYLEILKKFIHENKNPVFIDIAAGFDNFPFLVIDKCKFVELDLPHILEYKKNKLYHWMEENKIPKRKIEYIHVDLMDTSCHQQMKHELKQIIGKNISFIIMQGITYYLNAHIMSQIISILEDVQIPGSLLAIDFWKPASMELEVIRNIKKFLDERFGYEGKELNLLEEEYFKSFNGFELIYTTEIGDLELKYSNTRLFQGKENKIPVNFALLERV